MGPDDYPNLPRMGYDLVRDPSVSLVYNVIGHGGNRASRRLFFEGAFAQERGLVGQKVDQSNVKICADGDSWINILWPWSSILGYHRTLFDVIQSKGYYTVDVAYPGDTFQMMLAEKDYQGSIMSGIFDFFVFSGGGNDFLGGGALYDVLKWQEDGGGSTDPRQYLYLDALEERLGILRAGYITIADEISEWSGEKTRMLVHGYDYPVPRKNGPWLGRPFESKGYDLVESALIIEKILTYLVDSFYEILHDVATAARARNVTVVNLRNVCANRWFDELHPTTPASIDFAQKYLGVIGPPSVVV
jgi:hypothetical protein